MAHLSVQVGGMLRQYLRATCRHFNATSARTVTQSLNRIADNPERNQWQSSRKGQQVSKSSVKSKLNVKLENLQDVQRILAATEDGHLGPKDVSMVLERIGRLWHVEETKHPTSEEIKVILDDKRFDMIGRILHNGIDGLSVPALLSSLSCLLNMTDEDLFLTKSLEMQVLWLQKKLSVRQLVKVFEMHVKHQETKLRQEVASSTFELLQKRWVEIANPHDVVTLMYMASQDHPDFMAKLEERALDLTESMSAKDLYRILYILSKKSTRNMPLIRSIVYHLNKKFVQLTSVQLANLLYACAVLQIFDRDLLDQIEKQLLDDISEFVTPQQITALMLSFSMLRWKNEQLLEVLSATLLKDTSKMRAKDAASLLQICRNVNYIPQNMSVSLVELVDMAAKLRESQPNIWLDVVWSAAVLKCLNEQMVTSVINEEFIGTLQNTGADEDLKKTNVGGFNLQHIKLLNIKAAAELDLENCPVALTLDNTSIKVPVRSHRPLREEVLKALSSIAPVNKYLSLDVSTSAGYLIDIEMVVNNKAEPQAIRETVGSDCHRLAFKVLDFNDTVLGSAEPIGLHTMACRHLSFLGYKVIQVSHVDFSQCTTPVKQVQYLSQRIKEGIKEK